MLGSTALSMMLASGFVCRISCHGGRLPDDDANGIGRPCDGRREMLLAPVTSCSLTLVFRQTPLFSVIRQRADTERIPNRRRALIFRGDIRQELLRGAAC